MPPQGEANKKHDGYLYISNLYPNKEAIKEWKEIHDQLIKEFNQITF